MASRAAFALFAGQRERRLRIEGRSI